MTFLFIGIICGIISTGLGFPWYMAAFLGGSCAGLWIAIRNELKK